MRSGESFDFLDFAVGNIERIDATQTTSLNVDLQHSFDGFFPVHGEKFLQHGNDKIHRCEVIVKQKNLVQRRRFGLPSVFQEGLVLLICVMGVACICVHALILIACDECASLSA